MAKKPSILYLFVLFPILVGLACTCGLLPTGQDAEIPPVDEVVIVPTDVDVVIVATEVIEEDSVLNTETAVPEEETNQPVETEQDVVLPGEELVMLNDMWLQEENEVFVGFLLKNQFTDQNLKDISYKIILLDADNNEVRTASSRMDWIFPGQTVGVAYRTTFPADSEPINDVVIEYEFKSYNEPDEFLNPFTTEKIKMWEGVTRPVVTGIIHNNSTTTYTEIRTDIICYNAMGEIVGGANVYHKVVPGLGSVGFSENLYVYGDVDSIEVYPRIVTSSRAREDAEGFRDHISILDDYFYQTQTGGINGGVVIQNNLTDTVLKNSVVVVTVYDDDGYVTTYGYRDINYLMPGSTLGVMPSFNFQPKDVAPSTYEIVVLPGFPDDDYELQDDYFSVNSAVLREDNDNYVIVNYTSSYTKPVSEVAVFILLYNPEGQIIGGAVNKTDDPIPAGGSGEVEIFVFYSREHTVENIEVWLVPSIWTKFE